MDKREYEISFVLKNPNGAAVVQSVLSDYGASVTYGSPVNELRLAYPLKKERVGHFGFFYFTAVPSEISKIKESLKLKTEVLRILVVTPPVRKTEKFRRVPSKEESAKKVVVKAEEEIAPAFAHSGGGALTNEALEARLEEILK